MMALATMRTYKRGKTLGKGLWKRRGSNTQTQEAAEQAAKERAECIAAAEKLEQAVRIIDAMDTNDGDLRNKALALAMEFQLNAAAMRARADELELAAGHGRS